VGAVTAWRTDLRCDLVWRKARRGARTGGRNAAAD
jgi:hypothetical protein